MPAAAISVQKPETKTLPTLSKGGNGRLVITNLESRAGIKRNAWRPGEFITAIETIRGWLRSGRVESVCFFYAIKELIDAGDPQC